MPFKVKEHFRKTKSGKLSRVKESTRKDKLKKALLIGAGALTTAGLGAVALRKLNPKTALNTVTKISGKADDVAASKARDITELVTPKKLTQGKQYQTSSNPWLYEAVTVTKSAKAPITKNNKSKLLTGSNNKYQAEDIKDPWNSTTKPRPKLRKRTEEPKQLLLTGNKYKAESIPDPWEDDVIKGTDKALTVSKVKEKPLLLNSGRPKYESPTVPSKISNTKDKNLSGEIRSQRTLVKREPTDIKEANKKLELAERYKASDSPAYQRTGENYEKRATERLTTIASRSPSKKQTGLVTTRGTNKNTVRKNNSKRKTTKKKEEITVTKTETKPVTTETLTKPKTKKKSRRDLLTGKSNSQQLADNFIESTTKGAINKAGDTVSDAIIPGSSIVNKTIRDVKGRAKQVERLSNELAESGDKVSGRRGFLKKATKKLAEEASIKPADAEKVAKGTVRRSKNTVVKVLRTGSRGETKRYVDKNWHPFQMWEKQSKRVYRKPQGLLDRVSQGMRKAARYKSGKYFDTPEL